VKRSEKRLRVFTILISLFAVSCSAPHYKAPVVDARPIPSHRIRTHHVAPGETLYSIALRYDLDYKKLSEINDLGGNYRISPGQVLSLEATHSPAIAKTPNQPRKTSSVKTAKSSGASKNQTATIPRAPVPTKAPVNLQWNWPVKGEVLETFQANGGLNKGIDIRGKLGEPVLAAAEGEVVYSGSGLRGYGKLVIVKHDDQFLSAYAHNRVLVVAEGDKVKAGQKIAEVGFSGTNSAKLHFEIRVDGKPVDPLGYLPSLQ